ncbi:MAG: glycoside hydrolase family 15 protein [Gallionella sp.]|nr:glycoside hydrolase family 15 protein [Gallionella sp.]MDD4946297.1 glycoside hydrolase family 15 protein [Gallionella sp.]MDD5611978.1 glycoside hydrolase family 15 protein [Gallionella sp.]
MKAPPAKDSFPTWASAAKDMVGASLGSSRLWFTIADGILTEVYYPRIDIPQIKDLGFIIADDEGFWVELRRLGNYQVSLPFPGVPAVEIVHTHPRFTFTLQICPMQNRDVLMMRFRLEGEANLKPYALLSTRLGDNADNNLARVGNHNGRTILGAEQGPFGIALAACGEDGLDAWQRNSVGEEAASDGWQDFNQHGRMTWTYDSAGPGTTALTGELPQQATLSLGLATSIESAATLAVSGLMEKFSKIWDLQCHVWQAWQGGCCFPAATAKLNEQLRLSAMVLKVHQDRTYCGAAVASLSVPWGSSSQSRSGYHLVWSRDLVETAGAMVAMGSYGDAREVLRYLIATQQEDGHWLQNQWLGGAPYWQGIQLDEAAFPVILAATLSAHDELGDIPVKDMVLRALRFIACAGPSTAQDRWEEDTGINTFTLAIIIAALVEGSTWLDDDARQFALLLADNWNAHLDDWTFVQDTKLAKQLNINGYYIRTAPESTLIHEGTQSEHILIKNLACDPDLAADEQVATDFLQLVRYGLRRADDPRIQDSLKTVDHLLKTDTPYGPVWHRYNGDGYGEKDDGSPFDGTGRGRGWPLLVGERGHYALTKGEDPLPYLESMAAMSGTAGLMPEQVWDSMDIPERNLTLGKPSGSAMPLVWTHSEFIKLYFSRKLGYPVDRPAATWQRYQGKRPALSHETWGPRYHPSKLRQGNRLTISLKEQAVVHWGINGWKNTQDIATKNTGLGVWVAELPVTHLKAGDTIQFTFHIHDLNTWVGQDFEMTVVTT